MANPLGTYIVAKPSHGQKSKSIMWGYGCILRVKSLQEMFNASGAVLHLNSFKYCWSEWSSNGDQVNWVNWRLSRWMTHQKKKSESSSPTWKRFILVGFPQPSSWAFEAKPFGPNPVTPKLCPAMANLAKMIPSNQQTSLAVGEQMVRFYHV